jgi:amidohydrolase
VLAHLPATVANPGPCIGLRADMDALPITERTGKPWASTKPGTMHACGHDGHTAVLLGAARVLAGLDHRPNPVTFVFQPAEEGGAGGDMMCRDGALTGGPDGTLGPAVSRMYGLHGWPGLSFGVIGTRGGPLLAATDELHVEVRGVQAHAAYPHMGADPIVAASHIVTAVQTVASRTVSPVDSVVVTFGTFHAGHGHQCDPRVGGADRHAADPAGRDAGDGQAADPGDRRVDGPGAWLRGHLDD